jgi:microsomal dipeptidase-like Zn-dependent dipeptidase
MKIRFFCCLAGCVFVALLAWVGSSLHAQSPATQAGMLTGYVDMHAHPRGDLAYGRDLFYGAPYGDIAVALGNCKPAHGAKGFGNPHGNLLRAQVAMQTEQQNCATWHDGKEGYPNFVTWPSWCSILHQQMWIDWIERAHDHGLNIMCALAVSSHCIASAGKTTGPQDDRQVLYDIVQGIKDMVASSNFMEIAYSPEDARRIVGAGKLAVVLGTEMDNLGNWYSPADNCPAKFNPNPTNAEIQAELDSMWDVGIRYIFPVHLNNTVFGGTALALSTLNVANKFVTGSEYIPEQISTAESGIAMRLENPIIGLNAVAKMFMPLLLPKNINPGRKGNYTYWDTLPGQGHRNSLGITAAGRFGISYMMQKGFLIDIDHMSEKLANEVLQMALTRDYPVNSGHSGPRGNAGNEGGRTPAQYEILRKVGGMVGLGHALNAHEFVETYRAVAQQFGSSHIAIGTDVGGFSPLPAPDSTITITYDANFTRCQTGNRIWDFNVDGVAHYGLWPDYIRAWGAAGMTVAEKDVFMHSAEDFVQMWEKCARK